MCYTIFFSQTKTSPFEYFVNILPKNWMLVHVHACVMVMAMVMTLPWCHGRPWWCMSSDRWANEWVKDDAWPDEQMNESTVMHDATWMEWDVRAHKIRHTQDVSFNYLLLLLLLLILLLFLLLDLLHSFGLPARREDKEQDESTTIRMYHRNTESSISNSKWKSKSNHQHFDD